MTFSPTTRSLVLLILVAPLATGSGLHLLPAASSAARSVLPLALIPHAGTPAQAVGLFYANARVTVAPVVGAALLVALSRSGGSIVVPRALLDAYFAVSTFSNAATLTVALAGYGPLRLLTWLPHVPFEFAGFALALSTYRTARTRSVTTERLLVTAACILLAVAAAAVIETWLTPQR
jgi:hypothetical protein